MIICMLASQGCIAHSQTITVPQSWTTTEQITTLLNEPKLPNCLQVEARMLIYADNNVLPLKLGDDKPLPSMNFNDDYAYFANYRLKDLAISYRRWTLRHGYGKADFYGGNRDATQLYLDSMSSGVDSQKVYNVNASLNRTFLRRWTLEYAIPLKHSQGQISVAFHWLRIHRLQKGRLTGQMWLGQFEGDLHLLTTRGLPLSETRSNGVSVDLFIVAPISSRIKFGVWGENVFSKIWQRTLQEITAKVATNKVEPDADGFLHAVPLLQGRVEKVSLKVKAKQSWTIGAALRQGNSSWILTAKRERDWHIGIGYSFPIGQNKQVWFMVSERPIFWQVGINTTRFQLLLGVDKWNAATAKKAMTVVRWFWVF